MEEITFETTDGHTLPATLFESNAGIPKNGSLVLISSATAVPRKFYRRFAQYLADNGARAAMTYDYRGLNGEFNWQKAHSARMSQWALDDFPAAVKALKTRFPDSPLSGLGHSFGGQAFGLSDTAPQFRRYMTIAAGSGYAGFTREPAKNLRRLNWIGRPLAAIFGHLPRWAGLGEPLPYGVFNQWRRWVNTPHYFMHDESLPTTRFADVVVPMMSVGFEDDPLATRQSVEELVRWYARADIKLKWFSPAEAGGPIGHFGFFKTDHEPVLWPQIADWLTRP